MKGKSGSLAVPTKVPGRLPGVGYARNLDQIEASGTLKVGTTGDYKPFSFSNNGIHEGFDIAVARIFAEKMGVQLELIPTTWLTLLQDMNDGKFDIGMSGITRTVERLKEASFSIGYVTFGKTILVASSNAARFKSLVDIDHKEVRIGVNPGGTNERFVRANMKNAEVVMFAANLAIPPAIAAQQVDVMITDSVEALYYVATDDRLAAPLADRPFTRSEMGYLLPRTADGLQQTVNAMMEEMMVNGEMAELKKMYLHRGERYSF